MVVSSLSSITEPLDMIIEAVNVEIPGNLRMKSRRGVSAMYVFG